MGCDNTILRMTRREFLAASAAASAGRAAPSSRRPNILLILTDDQGYGDLGIHGNDKIRTPNIDRLAREGVQFTQFHVSPVCSPTRSSLMTGRYNYRTGVVDTYLGRSMMYPEEVTLAEMLGAAGYQTGIFGKWHLGDNYPLRAIDQGFHRAVVHKGGGLGQPSAFPDGAGYFDPILLDDGAPRRHKGYVTDIFTDEALGFIESNRNRPFFAYVATNAPHTPLEIADTWVEPYRKAGLDEQTARIYGMVTNLDENIGRLLAKLNELGLEQDTIVVFLTDNGPQQRRYNAGMRGLKGSVYEGGIRVPCFFRWPRLARPGSRIDRLAAHIDLAPTLLEASGVPVPKDAAVDGRSLLPLMGGGEAVWPDRTLFFQWHRGDEPQPWRQCAARDQRWKLVDGKELYDLDNDPAESRDRAGENPAIVERLRRSYEDWFRDVSPARGWGPPRIQLGTRFENPAILTRQDWRGPRAAWDEDSLGYWEVEVGETAPYEVTVTAAPAKTGGEVRFRFNEVSSAQPLATGAGRVRLGPVTLPAGDGRIEVEIHGGSRPVGAHYVELRRLSR